MWIFLTVVGLATAVASFGVINPVTNRSDFLAPLCSYAYGDLETGTYIPPEPISVTPEPLTPTLSPPPSNDVACDAADIVLIIDRSSSMNSEQEGKKRLDWAKEVATAFISSFESALGASNSSVRMSVVSFGKSLWPPDYGMPFPPGVDVYAGPPTNPAILHVGLTSDLPTVRTTVNTVSYRESGTCVQCGMYIANEELRTANPSHDTVRKIAIVLSDGKTHNNWDSIDDDEEALAATRFEADRAQSLGYEYYVVGYGEGSEVNEAILKQIASDPDELYYQYSPQPTDWAATFESVYSNICR
jgi:Mg-chelatase subunit ChlD